MMRAPVLLAISLSLAPSTAAARQAPPGGGSQLGAESLGERVVLGLRYAASGKDRRVLSKRPRPIALAPEPRSRITALPTFVSPRPLFGFLRLARAGRVNFALDQSEPGSDLYDVLYVDLNVDRDLTNDGEPFRGTNRYSDERARNYTEFPLVAFEDLYYSGEVREPYQLFFYVWYPPEGRPDGVFVCSASWREARVKVKGTELWLCVFDEDVDGLYAPEGCSWTVTLDEDPAGTRWDPSRRKPVSVPIRIGGVPWRIHSISPEGRLVELATETEENTRKAELESDPLLLEVPRQRVDDDPSWLSDLELAQTVARNERKRILLVFAAPWMESWRLLDRRTFHDSEVARLLRDYAAVLVPFEQRPEIARRFGVDVPPACLILDEELREIDRRVGYIPARAFEVWLEENRLVPSEPGER